MGFVVTVGFRASIGRYAFLWYITALREMDPEFIAVRSKCDADDMGCQSEKHFLKLGNDL